MSQIKLTYGNSTALGITLNGLANSAARESAAVDNSASLHVDAHVTLTIALSSGTPSSDRALYVYAFGSEDGTTFGDNATGNDAPITLRSPTNLRLIGILSTPDAGGLTYRSHPMSVASAFGGILPRKWGIVVENRTGLALAAGGSSASFSGVSYQTV